MKSNIKFTSYYNKKTSDDVILQMPQQDYDVTIHWM